MYNTIHIKNIGTTRTNVEIESTIESLLSLGRDERPDNIWEAIAELIGEIGDCTFLKATICRLRAIGLLKTRLGRLPIDDYSDEEKTKILASYYSLNLAYDYYEAMNRDMNADIESKHFSKGLPHDLPPLQVDINGGVLTFNIFEIRKVIQRKITITDVMYADNQDTKEREQFLRQLIDDFKELKYNTGHAVYQEQIDRLAYALEKQPEQFFDANVKQIPPHDLIFANDGFRLFDYFVGNKLRKVWGWQAKLAHIYWLMERDGYIRVGGEKFKRWFEKNYPEYGDVGKFRTLAGLVHVGRENEYKACVEWHKATA